MRLNLILTRSTCLYRTFSTTASAQAVDKSALAILRKKTGYTFSNCKKALEECGADLPKAEAWLKAQAQTLGWAKASQLQDRVVAQGLVGLKYSPEDGTGVLVEINCETDFVARNAKFHELVANVADACVRELELKPIDGASYHKWSITPELLSSFKTSHGKTLGDLTALAIGTMGENMVLRRALLVKADPRECKISGYAHAADTLPSSKGCYLGRYGALVIYRNLPSSNTSPPDGPTNTVAEPSDQLSTEDIGRQLCQHIVGMNPQSIGKVEDIEEKKDEKTGLVPRDEEDESRLIYQEFLADPTLTVRDVLEQNNMQILDFVRFECGRKSDDTDTETK